MRIILDTNWYISLLIKKNEARLHFILLNPSIELIVCSQLTNELSGKIKEEKFRKYFTLNHAALFVASIKMRATNVKVSSTVTICRDAKDNFLLALSRDASANFNYRRQRFINHRKI